MTLISRVLGFARDVTIAALFGAGPATDAFFVAFKIPNFFRRMFAEGAFSQAFVPVLAEYRTHRPEAVRALVGRVAGTLGAFLLALTVLALVAAPAVVALFAPGFAADPGRRGLAAALLRLTFPYLPLIALTALAAGVLNTWGRFAVPAATPVLLNLSLIGSALLLAPRLDPPVAALAVGVLLAGLTQLAFQLPFLARLGLLAWPRPAPRDPGVRRIVRLMGPALFGASVTQINLLVDTLIASFLVAGSISWLYYADRLVEFPLGVFGIALATVVLPQLARHHAAGRADAYGATLDWALRWVALITVPAAAGLAALAGPMLATLFQYRAFGGQDVEMAARALVAYAAGLPGFVLVKVAAPGFYARQDTRTPVRVALVAVAVNLALSLALVLPLAHAGLAAATSAAASVNGLALVWLLRRQGHYRPGPGWRRLGLQVAAATAAMTGVVAAGAGPLEAWLALDAGGRALRLALWIGLGAAVYGLVLWVLGLRPAALRAPAAA